MEKPYSSACERNRQPIFEVLARWLSGHEKILEVASGTGQHAVYFSEKWPGLRWQTTDLRDRLPGIAVWIQKSADRLPLPLELDLARDETWPRHEKFDGVFIANTFHIVSEELVRKFCRKVMDVLKPGGKLFVYGPFNYARRFTSESNREFDQWLKERDSRSGIRNFEEVVDWLEENGLHLTEDNAMPANNRLLVFSA